MTLPFPPNDLRLQVGPTDDASFDNPSGRPLFALPSEAYESVFDWGCGCGRLARQLIQQRPQPRRYLGVDLNLPAVKWCQKNLVPHAPQFEFLHQDVYNRGLNPSGTANVMRFPTGDSSVTLLIAWSVFTHTVEPNAPYYLHEVARVLKRDGFAVTTWLLFDKSAFPFMKDFQNALYINLANPSNAVVYDKQWLRNAARRAGLVLWKIARPAVPGGPREVYMRLLGSGVIEAEFTSD